MIGSAWRALRSPLGCLALGLVLGFVSAVLHLAAHRAPPEVREVERVVERVVTVERKVEVAAKQAAKVERVVVYRDRLTMPDGTRREREIAASSSAEVESLRVERSEVRASESVLARTSERTVSRSPDWRAGVLLGAQVAPELRPAFGLHAERRLVGPVFAGAWGLNTGAAGVSLSFEF